MYASLQNKTLDFLSGKVMVSLFAWKTEQFHSLWHWEFDPHRLRCFAAPATWKAFTCQVRLPEIMHASD